jgi:hypothetical protein
MSKIFRFTVLCSVLLLCAAMAFAASQNAVVYGTVYDASAKPLGGVKVTLENPAIAVNRSTMTAADGSYSFSEVAPASGYKVSATQNGTLIDARTDITVNVGEESVIFPALKASATPKPAESSAMNMPVSTDKIATAQSGVITGEQLRSLPLYNRNFLTLGTLTPHTHPSGAGDPLGDASFSVAGNRSTGNSFLVDGADNRASSSNQAVPFQVNDAIQEFRVISSAGNAEYGGNGGTINVVTKRGGNNWHGSAFGYFGADQLNGDSPVSVFNGSGFDQAMSRVQNPFGTTLTTTPQYYNDYVATAGFTGFCTDGIDVTGATGAFPCAGGVGTITGGAAMGNNTLIDPVAFRAAHDQFKQPWQSQQFGANIGGPIMKDKVFVFGSYEGTHIDNPNQVFERVASAFDHTLDPYGAGMNIPNPADFAQTQALLSLMPTSNVVAVPGVMEFWQGQTPNHTMVHNGVGRVDWVYGPKDSFGARWLGQWLDQLHDDTMPASGTYAGNGSNRNAFNQNLDLNYTHIFSSTLLNQAHAGFNRFLLKESPQDRNFDATTLGLSNPKMMTYMLAGLDPQYSGAVPAYAAGCTGTGACNGAIGGWNDSPDGTFQFLGGAPAFNPMDPTMDGLFPFMRIGAPLYSPSVHEDWSWFGADNVSWTKGRHQFKFGAEYDHFLNGLNDGGMNRGLVYTGNIGQFTHGAETCNSFCDIFSPIGSLAFTDPGFDFAQKSLTPYNIDLYSHNVAFFAEDTIHAYSRLTVTLGIRWEYFSRPLEQHDQLWNFDPQANGLVQQGSTSVVSQFGDICSGTGTSSNNQADFGLGNYGGSLPQILVDPNFAGFAGQWSCLATGRSGLDHTAWTNFAPRIGAAWDLFGDGKTVARFGVGMFYDREPSSYFSQLAYNRPTSLFVPGGAAPNSGNPATQMAQSTYGGFYNFANYGFTNLDPNTLSTNGNGPLAAAVQPYAMYGRDPNHDSNPRVWQLNANIQHQFANTFVAEAGFVGSYGGKLPTFSNVNFNNEWYCSAAVIGGGAPGNCDNNSFSPAFYQSNQGESQYNSVYVRARVAEWHGLQLNGTYTFSHARDNASALVFPQDPITYFNNGCGYQGFSQGNFFGCTGGLTAVFGPGGTPIGGGNALASTVQPLTTTGQFGAITTPYYIPQDPYNLKGNWGRSDYNSNHRFVVDWTYNVPSTQKMWGWSKYTDYWQLSGVTIVQSGQPYSIFSSVGNELTSLAVATGPVATSTNPSGAIDITNLNTAPNVCGALVNPSPAGWFAADGQVGTPCLGNTQRNEFTGPMYSTFNMSIQKGFPIGSESKMLNFRAEFYNLFGADNFYNPISMLSTDGFTLNPDFGKIKSAHDPRQIQFAVRFNW